MPLHATDLLRNILITEERSRPKFSKSKVAFLFEIVFHPKLNDSHNQPPIVFHL